MILRHSDPRAVRGAAAPRLVAIIVAVLILAAAGWWFFLRPPSATAPKPGTPGTPAAGAPAGAESAAPAPTVSDELTTDELYREAHKAMSDNRMVAPAGNNALEFYLKIVAKNPDDTGAKDALRELFPFATGAAEDQINQGAFDEANRIIGLLAQADPNNYSLTILRSKLDAKKKVADREAQQAQLAAAAAARQQAAGAANANQPAGETAAPTPGTTETGTASTAPAGTPPAGAAPVAENATASTTPPPAPAAPKPAPTPPPAPKGETRDAEPIAPAVPEYPITAARNRQEGWVEVEFTVGADSSIQNVHVVGSNPPRVFDRAAISAVQKARYSPRLENGKAVASTLRRRIEFKLGR